MFVEAATTLSVPLSEMDDRLPDLSETESRQCVYICGAADVELLASRVELHGLTGYYTSMRPGSTWRQSFEDAYGVSVAEFYALFE